METSLHSLALHVPGMFWRHPCSPILTVVMLWGRLVVGNKWHTRETQMILKYNSFYGFYWIKKNSNMSVPTNSKIAINKIWNFCYLKFVSSNSIYVYFWNWRYNLEMIKIFNLLKLFLYKRWPQFHSCYLCENKNHIW